MRAIGNSTDWTRPYCTGSTRCIRGLWLATSVLVALCSVNSLRAAEAWRVGVAKVDITPTEPLRLSGYAVRVESHQGAADPLFARAMVLSPARESDESHTLVLVSIDSIGVTSNMTVELAQWLEEKYQLPRSQLVVSSTHSHAAPQVDGLLRNIFRQPSTPEQTAATERYTQQMSAAMCAAINAAMQTRQPAQLSLDNSEARFAVNRRVLKEGSWTGFGIQADGVVDHRVRMLIARSPSGEVLGSSFLYACHCTTLGGDFNQVSGDWAGLSASRLEQLHPGSVFLPVIGCGADANPNPRGTYEQAQQHAAELVSAIESKLATPQTATPLPTDKLPVARFGYAGLAPEQPTAAHLAEMQNKELPNDRRWAEEMLAIKKEMGRLPETYPMPIHTWQFGDELAWVFLGGEVVIDYQFQLEKELPTRQTWVAAYTDDVFAYVASQRMRDEGGYEVDFSMIYYLQPGRWQSGTQSLIVRRVREILSENYSEERPLTASEALAAVQVPEDYRVELVAAEPLVQDPVNLAFGPDGRVWVVEMSDYPLGVAGGGRVKWLRDVDGDGTLDESQVFAEGLSYPTSVFPWRDGALIIAAPDILFARDTTGDGRADQIEPWLSGIDEANPQHRASGFELGLDGWLHFATGHGTKVLHSRRNGKSYTVNSRDASWNPDTGEVRINTGETQFVRSHDNFGNWFGNSNSRPMYQFVIEDRYLDGQTVTGGPRQDLLTPAVAPPVYPRSRTLDRFNDLYAFNRFTSACSSIIVRAPGVAGKSNTTSALVCEPVHNLVARIELNPSGSHFTATHAPAAGEFDFFTSTDAWSRPVRAINAPDGSVWIVDMVRRVIEHPEWIPTAWQQRLDLRAGAQLGRIYRVAHRDWTFKRAQDLTSQPAAWLEGLADENGAVRDLALQAILHAEPTSLEAVQPAVRQLAHTHESAEIRAAALGCLAAKDWLTAEDLVTALGSSDPRLARWTLELAERFPEPSAPLAQALKQLVARNLGPAVDLQWVLSSTRLTGFEAQSGLTQIAARSGGDPWLLKSLALVRQPSAALAIVAQLLEQARSGPPLSPQTFGELEQCLVKLWPKCEAEQAAGLALEQLQALLQPQPRLNNGQLLLLSCIAQSGRSSASAQAGQQQALKELLDRVTERIVQELPSDKLSEAEQLTFINLLGSGLTSEDNELRIAAAFLHEDNSLQVRRTTIESLRRLRSPQVAEALLGRWPQLNAALRSSAGATLLSRREWALALVGALEAGHIPTAELDLATIGQLSTYGERELRNRCVELLGQSSERAGVVADYLTRIPAPQPTAAGERLFVEHCSACHRAANGQPQLGPPLENLGHWTLDQWVTAVLDPNQTVEPKYRQTTLLTTQGQVVAGLVLERSPQELLVGLGDGSTRRVAVGDIEDEKDAGPSLMPVGFEQKLTPEQLAELIGYLRRAR